MPKTEISEVDARILAKKKRIAAEETRLNKIYSTLSKDTRSSVDGLIKRAAYMRVTLEDYEADIDENGSVEEFQQTPNVPSYERVRPVAQLYNTLNKNYQSIIKMLNDLLPKEPPKSDDDDGFDAFTNKRDK